MTKETINGFLILAGYFSAIVTLTALGLFLVNFRY